MERRLRSPKYVRTIKIFFDDWLEIQVFAAEHNRKHFRSTYRAFGKFSNATAREICAAKQATCIAYVSPKLEGATSLFERINMRGRKVSQFDLVKNRLIGWTGSLRPEISKGVLQTIASGYSDLYRLLNPSFVGSASKVEELDVDRLLRVHWILFTTSTFNSADRVIEAIESERARIATDSSVLANYIRRYVDTLLEVTRVWVQIFNPVRLPASADDEMRKALNEFNRLDRVSELDPLIAAVMLRYGAGLEAARFVRLCTIGAFRDALAKRRSNRGRSPKWTIARSVYQDNLVDAVGSPIKSISALSHHFFWKTMSWWDVEESKLLDKSEYEVTDSDCASVSLHSSGFYQEFRGVLHYFFWEYALMLRKKSKPPLFGWEPTQGDVFLNDFFWATFRGQWDIEHVFPVKPDYKAATTQGIVTKLKKHEQLMRPLLNHLGNLTVVPLGENRGLLSNSDFATKREEMIRRDEVLFNRLFRNAGYTGNQMNKPFWGPNNCKRRSEHLINFANVRWGTSAIRALGVSAYDKRVTFEMSVADEDDVGGEEQVETAN